LVKAQQVMEMTEEGQTDQSDNNSDWPSSVQILHVSVHNEKSKKPLPQKCSGWDPWPTQGYSMEETKSLFEYCCGL
jgi:hypothetical protein